MNTEEIIFEQYKLYTEQKERFVDRSFKTNKFYLVIVLAIFLMLFTAKTFVFAYGLTSTLVYSVIGAGICIMWWINMDAYNFLLQVKLGQVIEEIEKQLPVKPYTQEFVAIKDLRKNKRMFLFADIQKSLALFAFLFYFVIFVNELVPIIFPN